MNWGLLFYAFGEIRDSAVEISGQVRPQSGMVKLVFNLTPAISVVQMTNNVASRSIGILVGGTSTLECLRSGLSVIKLA